MCGIAGLFIKNPAVRPKLGHLVAGMMGELSDRGPDSAGFAVYGAAAPSGALKATLFHGDEAFAWDELDRALEAAFGLAAATTRRGSHRIVVVRAEPAALRRFLDERFPGLRLMGLGERVEIFKEQGLPGDVIGRFHLDEMAGSHALGHTRMATESAVTTEHSHPFSTGPDLCLVHNGSLSNHNRWRRTLERAGIVFSTDNDSEVAAGYLTWRLGQGATLDQALEAALVDLDGFYTFAVGTKDGFAILRDPIACKPAVLAETDDWVAMATEYRAIATLPGADAARIWEPRPATVYAWRQ